MDSYSTPNFTKGRTDTVRWIVMHSTRGGSNDDYTATINWFRNPAAQVSSHLLVACDGRVARFVKDEDTAWHAGLHNPYTLGMELEQSTGDTRFEEPQLAAAAECVREWRRKFGDIAVVGHDNTPQGIQSGKSDPGHLFPWSRFMEMVNDMADPEARKAIAILKQQESLKAAVGDNDMVALIARLQYFGVLPPDVPVKKPHLDGA